MKSFAKNTAKKGSSHASSHNHGNEPFFGVQAKLSIGKPGDKYEREADSVADKIVARESGSAAETTTTFFPPAATPVQRLPFEEVQQKEEAEEVQEKPLAESISPIVQLASDDEDQVQEKCAECEREEQLQQRSEGYIQAKCAKCEAEEKQIQKLPFEEVQQKNNEAESRSHNGFESTLNSSKGGGTTMEPHTRSKMESGFGADLGHVRVHTGSSAVQMNQELGSQAFTNGSDIYFNQGKYEPGTSSGDHLLAHELTHTFQQGASQPGIGIQRMPQLSTKAFKGKYNLNYGKRPTIQAFGLSDIGDALSAGADFISDTAGDAVDWAGEAVSDALELGADALMAIVRQVSPTLAEIIENGPIDMIAEALNGGIQSWLAGIFGELGIGEFITNLRQNFEGIFNMLMGVVTGDEASCQAFNQAIQGIRTFIEDFMNNPFFEAIRGVFEQVSSFLSEMFDLLVAPILDAVLDLVGDAFSVVRDIASTIWGWISAVKDYLVAAWNWVMDSLGISGDGEGGVWEWIKGFASDIWEEIKATFEPVIVPLQIILGILVAISPVGPLLIALVYGPRVVEAIQWLWANKDNPNIVSDAREQMGDGILPQLLEAGESFINEIQTAIGSMIDQFVGLHTALLEFLGAVTGVPLLQMAQSFVQTVSQGVQDFIAWGQEKLQQAISLITTIFQKIRATVEPYIEILTSIALAIGNPFMIPIMLMGWAWRALPDCYKPPIIDFLLDGIIGYLEALPNLPMMGPLWPLLKPFIIGFLQRFRSATDEEKITITNKLAKIISGSSIDFIIGFVMGFLRGIWEGLTDPFVLIYQILSGLSSLTQWFMGLFSEEPAEEQSASTSGTPTGTGGASASAAASTTAGGITEESGSSGSGTQPIPAEQQQAIMSRMREMGGELQEPAGQVTGNFMDAASEFFQGGEMTFESLSEKLGDMWNSAQEAIRGAGASLAESMIGFFTGESAEREMGEGIGWLTGTIVFEVVLGVLTAGTYQPVSAVGKALKFFAKVLDWTGEAMGLAFKALGKLGKLLMKLFDKLMEMATRATGALRIVMDALREIGEKVIRFADELFGRVGRGAGGEAAEAGTERAAREATEAAGERSAREGAEATAEETAEEVAEEVGERGAREGAEETGERGAREGADDAAKAAEMPAAMAQAKAIEAANDAVDVPVLVTVAQLNAVVKSRYRWIERFEHRILGPGRYSIRMIASDTEVGLYTDDNEIPSPTSRQNQFDAEINSTPGLTPEQIDQLQAFNKANPQSARNVEDVLKDINNRRVLDPNTGRFSNAPEVADITPRADLPAPDSPEGVAFTNYLDETPPRTSAICFPPGTLIATPNGPTPIEEIKTNDFVWSFDHNSNSVKLEIVNAIRKNWTKSLTVITTNDETIEATGNHPFFVEDKVAYLFARNLEPGMQLRNLKGELKTITNVTHKNIICNTYNFEAGSLRNYFAGTAKILVHNDDVEIPKIGSFASTQARPSSIYVITDRMTGEVIYVGQTVQQASERFTQHLNDASSSVSQYLERNYPGISEDEARRILGQEVPVDNVRMTHYELTMHEQHHINLNGGIDGLENKVNAITPENATKYSGAHNPCAY